MVLITARENADTFPMIAFVDFLSKFNHRIWDVFIARGIVVENRFPAAFIRSVLHTCIRFFFVQGMNAPDPSKLATLPHVTLCEKKLRRRIQFVTYITQDQFKRFPNWLTNDANSNTLRPKSLAPRPKSFRSALGRPRRLPRMTRARSQEDFEPQANFKYRIPSSRPTAKRFFTNRRPVTPMNPNQPKQYFLSVASPVCKHVQHSSWSSSFRASNDNKKLTEPISYSHWLDEWNELTKEMNEINSEIKCQKHFDPTPSTNDTLDGNESVDCDGISALSIISDTDSVTSAKKPRFVQVDYNDSQSSCSINFRTFNNRDSCVLVLKNRKPVTPLEPHEKRLFPPTRQCHSDESISISRPATRPQSRQVSASAIPFEDSFLKLGSADTYESLHQVYKFVSEMEDGLFQQYASILLKNRISWNVLSVCVLDDLTDLGIPRIHARFILSQMRKLIVE